MTNRDQVAIVAQQIGTGLMPDNANWENRFVVLSTSSSSVYTVAQRKSDGVWGCSCRGWTHYRRCKHLTDVLARLAQFATSIPLDDSGLDDSVVEMLSSARTAFLDVVESAPVAVAVPRISRQLDL